MMASAANRVLGCVLALDGISAHSQQLHRCVSPDGHVTWQDVPCVLGSAAEVRTYNPQLAGTAAEQERLESERQYNEAMRARVRTPPLQPESRQWSPGGAPLPQKSAACEAARAAAEERRDRHGRRLSLDEIRVREQHAEAVCSTYPDCYTAALAGDRRMGRSHPRYAPHLDHDRDGIACE